MPIYQNFPNKNKMHKWHPSKLGPTSGSRDDIVRTYTRDQNCRVHHELHLCLVTSTVYIYLSPPNQLCLYELPAEVLTENSSKLAF